MKNKQYYTTTMTISDPRNDSDMEITVRGCLVDNGIGAYEYWGAKGVDHQMGLEWELVSCPIPDEVVYENSLLCDLIEQELTTFIEEVSHDNHAE